MDRQIAPPPPTFSAQPSYLGQTPASPYVPQSPATPYAPSTGTAIPLPNAVSPSPTGATTYSGSTTSGYGSINANPKASLFQSSPASSPTGTPSAGTNGWTASTSSSTPAPAVQADQASAIALNYGSQTAFQSMSTQTGTITQTAPDGTMLSTYVDPNSLVVSSAQMTTKVVGDETGSPAATVAEPNSMYANQYQFQ